LPVSDGCRYTPGYPVYASLEDQTKPERLPGWREIGLSLTEDFQLVPEQSTSAFRSAPPRGTVLQRLIAPKPAPVNPMLKLLLH